MEYRKSSSTVLMENFGMSIAIRSTSSPNATACPFGHHCVLHIKHWSRQFPYPYAAITVAGSGAMPDASMSAPVADSFVVMCRLRLRWLWSL